MSGETPKEEGPVWKYTAKISGGIAALIFFGGLFFQRPLELGKLVMVTLQFFFGFWIATTIIMWPIN